MNNLERTLKFLKKELADHKKNWENRKNDIIEFASMIGDLEGLLEIAIHDIEIELEK